MLCDNTSAIYLSQNPILHLRGNTLILNIFVFKTMFRNECWILKFVDTDHQ